MSASASCHAVTVLYRRRIVKIPADTIAGTKHVIGIVPLSVDTDDAKDDTDSLLLRFSDHEQVSRVHSRLQAVVNAVAALLMRGCAAYGAILH